MFYKKLIFKSFNLNIKHYNILMPKICFLYTDTNGLHKTNDYVSTKNLYNLLVHLHQNIPVSLLNILLTYYM